jgi:hypothetical protein
MRILVIFFLAAFQLNAQHTIGFYCDVMANSEDGNNRVEAGKQFYTLFTKALQQPNSYNEDFKNLKWISQKQDMAKEFRIFTWQIKDDKNIHESYGIIQVKDGTIYPLKDGVASIDKDLEYQQMDPESWHGALYYNMKEVKVKNETQYVLFGYDGFDDQSKIKVIDVLKFEKNKPVFGSELFKMNNEARPDVKSRVIIDYGAVANVTCNYNEELGLIMFDNLILRNGVAEDGGPAKIPAGYYSGFKWEGNYWVYMDKLANEITDSKENIFFQPKKEEVVKKDILGRSKN